MGAGNRLIFMYRFEGQDLQHLAKGTANAKAVTLSFWVKSTQTGNHQVNITDDNSRMIGAVYAVSSANTWEKKVITFAGDTTGGTIDNDNTQGMAIEWWLSAGSNYNSGAVPTSWEANAAGDRAVEQQNYYAASGRSWQITGIQLELGSSATPFEHRSYGDELRRCQRYCQVYKSDAEDNSNNSMCTGWAVSTTAARFIQPFPVWFRAVPSLSFPMAVSSIWISDGATASRECNSLSVNPYITAQMMDLSFGIETSGATAFRPYYFFLGNPSSYRLIFSAEL
jgi:hypothetical protein